MTVPDPLQNFCLGSLWTRFAPSAAQTGLESKAMPQARCLSSKDATLGGERDAWRRCRLGNVSRVTSAILVLLVSSGCEAETSVRSDSSTSLLTGREIHQLQNFTAMEAAGNVQVGNRRYSIPRVPYIDLAEFGHGTPTAYKSAAVMLRTVKMAVQQPGDLYPPRNRVLATVDFNRPRGPAALPAPAPTSVPVPDGWVRSERGLPELPDVDLWLDTQQCVDDLPPPPSPDKSSLRIQAMWTVDDVPLLLICDTPLAPNPSGQLTLRCNGGSEPTHLGVVIGFQGLVSLERGCRAALEELAPSFAYLPLIVADWLER